MGPRDVARGATTHEETSPRKMLHSRNKRRVDVETRYMKVDVMMKDVTKVTTRDMARVVTRDLSRERD